MIDPSDSEQNMNMQSSFAISADDAIDPQWYALRVAPQKEYVIAELLRKDGMATFVPTEIRTHKRSSYAKSKVEFAVPILAGCVFVGFPSAPPWYDVLRNHLILGPISLGTEGLPTRLDFIKLLRFFSGVNDGCMVRDGGLRLIHIPGRSPVRPLQTRVRTISPRKRKQTPEPKADQPSRVVEVAAPRKYADFLSRFVYGGTV